MRTRVLAALLLRCAGDGCTGMVNLQSARRAAKRAGRGIFKVGDGCGSRQCSRNFQAGQYADGQRRMAATLESGAAFLLTEWPESTRVSEAEAHVPACSLRMRGGGDTQPAQ